MSRTTCTVFVIVSLVAAGGAALFIKRNAEKAEYEKLYNQSREIALMALKYDIEETRCKAALAIYEGVSMRKSLERYERCLEAIVHRKETPEPEIFNAVCVNSGVFISWSQTWFSVNRTRFRVRLPHGEVRIVEYDIVPPPDKDFSHGPLFSEFITPKDQPRGESTAAGRKASANSVLSYLTRENVEVDVQLIGENCESKWMSVIPCPPKADLLFDILRNAVSQPYFDSSGNSVTVYCYWLVNVRPELLPDDPQNINKLYAMVELWVCHRTIQWLNGMKVPECYVLKFEKDSDVPDPASKYVSHTIYKLLLERIDEPSLRLDGPVYSICTVMPASADQSWADYLRMLESNPETKPYLDAIKEAEKNPSSVAALQSYNSQVHPEGSEDN